MTFNKQSNGRRIEVELSQKLHLSGAALSWVGGGQLHEYIPPLHDNWWLPSIWWRNETRSSIISLNRLVLKGPNILQGLLVKRPLHCQWPARRWVTACWAFYVPLHNRSETIQATLLAFSYSRKVNNIQTSQCRFVQFSASLTTVVAKQQAAKDAAHCTMKHNGVNRVLTVFSRQRSMWVE